MKQGVSRGFCSTCLARLNRYARFEYVHAEKELSVVVDERKKVREDDDDEEEERERVGKIVESGD